LNYSALIKLDFKKGKKLKTCTLFILLLVICQSSTFAKETSKLIRMKISSGSEFYRAANYRQINQSTYSILVEEHYTPKSTRRISGAAYNKTLYILDCNKDLYRMDIRMNYDSQDKLMGGGSTPAFRFSPISTDTIAESLHKTICLSKS
jgi:hypothetical protein